MHDIVAIADRKPPSEPCAATQALLAAVPAAAALVDREGRIVAANPAWAGAWDPLRAGAGACLLTCLNEGTSPARLAWRRRQAESVLRGQKTAVDLDISTGPPAAPRRRRLRMAAVRGQPFMLATIIDPVVRGDTAASGGDQVLAMISDGVLLLDEALVIRDVNPALCALLGMERADLRTRPFVSLLAGQHLDRHVQRRLLDVADGGRWSAELPLVSASGSDRHLSLSVLCRSDARGRRCYVVTCRDRGPPRVPAPDLPASTGRDPLTGLADRESIAYDVDLAIAHADGCEQICLVLIGLDRFSLFNDSLGYAIGDELLRAVSRRLQSVLTAGELVARLASDEFAVYVPGNASAETARRCVEQLRGAMKQPFNLAGQLVELTVSVGISSYPQDGLRFADLLRSAGAALRAAKKQGPGNVVCYDHCMGEANLERLTLRGGLSSALARNEFVIFYQPTVDLRTGRVAGVEALVRWMHPTLGLVMPDRFIGLAEDCQMIGAIGEHVLTMATAAARRWHDLGHGDVKVAVNISAGQLTDPDLPQRIWRALDAAGLPPSGLRLEVTESVLMDDPEAVREVLAPLAEAGIGVAIDDFGTGYSSLAYLQRLPITCVKVDRSFVREVPGTRNSEAIVRAVVAMARSLDLAVVAEGVESPEQEQFLVEIGCSEAQGFMYCRPVPESALNEWLRNMRGGM